MRLGTFWHGWKCQYQVSIMRQQPWNAIVSFKRWVIYFSLFLFLHSPCALSAVGRALHKQVDRGVAELRCPFDSHVFPPLLLHHRVANPVQLTSHVIHRNTVFHCRFPYVFVSRRFSWGDKGDRGLDESWRTFNSRRMFSTGLIAKGEWDLRFHRICATILLSSSALASSLGTKLHQSKRSGILN